MADNLENIRKDLGALREARATRSAENGDTSTRANADGLLPHDQKAVDALARALERVKAEQLEARKRREELAAALDRLKQIEAAGERLRANRAGLFYN